MRLSLLVRDIAPVIGPDVEVRGLALDSRRVRPGDLFAALPGSRTDGLAFADAAIAAGAAALLGDDRLRARSWPVPVVVTADPRSALCRLAARFFGAQPPIVVGVTGTSGKTSVAEFTRGLWERLGHRAASLGTLGLRGAAGERPGALTTPDPIELHATLAELARAGVDRLVMEVSSHALDQRRVEGVRFSAAAFTNLSRDHLDYHGTMEAYRAAKLRLFRELLPEGATAVVDADVPEAGAIAALARARGLELLDYGKNARRLRLLAQTPLPSGQRVELLLEGRPFSFETRLLGPFQARNLLAALGLVLATGAPLEAAVAHLSTLSGAPGRMQHVADHPAGAGVYVDYAHKPEALRQALEALRPHCRGRLHLVFGCGGDRDPGKRPLMGAIAHELADVVIVTDDNPRSEDPAAIRAAILAACPKAREIGDRRAAIAAALDGLRAGDLLLIAGKGHETYQILGATAVPFDDAAVVRELLGGTP
ncbi:MAG: UDP-N-acetylmuramoyl-L-alanyl-D-glutamate--2,6-diaminopimelate ligase [Geminicoccaceae bacterium]|nr:UDP-N-acetylmuramoyl-L-alanyl-D-glutamate--2,6-diaminopimelate ligase [Geminicoccaceae bacterium]